MNNLDRNEAIFRAKEALDEFLSCVGEPGANQELGKLYREFKKKLELKLLPQDAVVDNEVRKGAQSKQFMAQIAPYAHAYMRRHEKGKVFDILDVGCGTGHGSNFLASLYQTMELGYRARVTAVDVDSTYHEYARFFCPYIVHNVVSDISEINRTFDIVIASHVVEHVRNPVRFVEKLKLLSTGLVIICAPYDESPDAITDGHVNIIGDELISQFSPTAVDFVESPAWGQFMVPRYKMFIATIER